MTTLDDRKSAFENKYAHDEELAFKINAKRNKLLAGWAAKEMHLNEASTEAFVQDIVFSQLNNSSLEEMVDKILHSMVEAGVKVERIDVEKQLDNAAATAKEQFEPK